MKVGNERIKIEKSAKFLGVVFDHKLSRKPIVYERDSFYISCLDSVFKVSKDSNIYLGRAVPFPTIKPLPVACVYRMSL